MSSGELSLLRQDARRLGTPLSRETAARLVGFLDLLYRWNRSARLTAIARRDAVRLHLLDSLSALPLLEGAESLADVGTGGGLPGIPLAIVNPQVHVWLIESKRRRCSFLRHVLSEMSLTNCEVVEGDAGALRKCAPGFSGAIARAFARPPEFLEVASGIVEPGGIAVVMGGASLCERDLDTVARRLGAVVEACRRVVLPGGTEKRVLLRYRFAGGPLEFEPRGRPEEAGKESPDGS